MQAFFELMSLLILVAAGLTLIAGGLNALFDWNLALKIGGSQIPLPEDFTSVVFVALGLVVCSGLFFLLADLKRPFRFLKQHRRSALAGLGVGVAIAIIAVPRALPNFFLELAVQSGDSEKAEAMLEQRDYPVEVLDDLTYWALKNEDYDVAQLMFDQGADINHRRGEFESTLLHDATTFFAPTATDFLLEQGVDVNAQDDLGRTALHVLMTYRANNVEGADEAQILTLTEKLLAAGADATVASQAGETAATLAENNGYEQVVQLLQGG
ncbi:MAG: ankyrin repeat domain-containing protein [Elainellaceae cyanobacterium]